jgi:hypothetical protein
MERWEPVTEFPEYYEVSSRGCIRNLMTGRLLTPCSNGKGVIKVVLSVGGRKYTRSVSRIMALAFIGEPPEPNSVVIYKDNDYSNLDESNLTWSARWFAQERIYQLKRGVPLRSGRIRMEATGRVYESSYECAMDINGIEKYIVLCATNPQTHMYMGSSFSWI